jgi:hypothetical protein
VRACISLLFVSFAATSLGGCSSDTPESDLEPVEVGCNPVVGADCMTPFPSSFHMVADATTATGVRVNLDGEWLPVSNPGVVFDPVRFNRRDGFSSATPFIVHFAEGVDMSQLPDSSEASVASSVEPTSKVQIVDAETGERIPLFAELDVNAQPWERQALLIRPMVRLAPATRYIIAFIELMDAAGQPLLPKPFAALRDRLPLNESLAPLEATYEDMFARLESHGIERESLSLAWEMTTGSDAPLTEHLLHMREIGFAMQDSLGYTVTAVEEFENDAQRLRELEISFEVPWFLASDEDTALMQFDAAFLPQTSGTADVSMLVQVPRCAVDATEPLPVLVFGHGLFGDATTIRNGLLLELANRFCHIVIATDWIGLSSADLLNLQILATNINQGYFVTDRLQQAHLNHLMMTRLFKLAMKDDDALAIDGQPITDGETFYYFGVSNGGIQGGGFMALTPDVERGVLNVPGGNWNIMMYRSTHFQQLLPLLAAVYPDALDRQMLVAMTQFAWDYTDPITYAPHLLGDSLPGVPDKQILVQESIGDAQVPNIATRLFARTMGIQALPLVEEVYGLDVRDGPLDSAYTQWDSGPNPLPPTGNTPADDDNGAHDAIRSSEDLQEQLRLFFQPDGQVVHTCEGPCSF